MLKDDEHFEPLGGGFEVIVSKEHGFWTDTILLADFAKPKKNDIACDLGTGCGTIPFIWCKNGMTQSITAVEIQQNAVDMAWRSVKHNDLDKKVSIINADLKKLNGVVPASAFDLVVCNPPYKAAGTGIQNPSTAMSTARHENACTIDNITACAARLLKFSGRFCLCQRPERLADVLVSMRKNKLEPKRLRFVQQNPDKKPKLFLVEGRRSGKPGGLIVEPVLLIENESGGISQEMLNIYGDYKDNHR